MTFIGAERSSDSSFVETIYQIMANVWPNQTEETWPGADRMNSVPKVVFSRSLDKVEWGKWNNASLVKDNIPEAIAKMKQQPGKNIPKPVNLKLLRTEHFTNGVVVLYYEPAKN